MTGLTISRDGFTLPLEFVVEASAILAMRGSGKTYLAKVVAEEVLDAKQQLVILDPKGDLWGLKSNAAGDTAAYPIIVFGGEHADAPLEETAGELLADLVVDSELDVILDLSDFSKAGARRFAADFLERLYWRKRTRAHQTPLLVIIDEADAFVPQRIPKGGERCYGAVDTLVRRGRGRGLGTLLITQRPAVIAKDVLTQVSVLIAMRIGGRNDIVAIDAWIQAHGDVERAGELKGSLPSLPTGSAWVWGPYLLGGLHRVDVRAARTFDSSATPAPGEIRRQPRKMAVVDLDALGEKIAATVERAKADDPRELRKRIAELERDLAAERAKPQPEPTVERVEVPVLDMTIIDRLEEALGPALNLFSVARETLSLHEQWLREQEAPRDRQDVPRAREAVRRPDPVERPRPARRTDPAPRREPSRPTFQGSAPTADLEGAGDVQRAAVTGPQQKILDALAWLATVGVAPATRLQAAMVAGYHPRTKGFTNALGAMRTDGLIDYPQAGTIGLTDAGAATALPPPRPLTDADLQQMVYAQVGPARSRILQQLVDVYPESMSRTELADALGYHERTKGFTNGLGSLRSLGLLDYPQAGYVVASDLLFAGGR